MIKAYTQNGSLIIEDQLAATSYTITLMNPGALVCVYDAKSIDGANIVYKKRPLDKGEFFFEDVGHASEFVEDMIESYVNEKKYRTSQKLSK